MNQKEKKFKEILNQFMNLIHKFRELEENPMDFGSGDILYRSEIHAIEAIGNNHGINVTELAAKLGITKGTASQLISKLAKKGLVNKTKGNYNEKEILLKHTEKGRKAFNGHLEFHQKMYMDFMELFNNVSLKQLNTFGDVLIKIKNNMDKYI